MTTKTLFCVLLTLCNILLRFIDCGFQDLQQSGCEYEFIEEKCVYEAYCVSYVENRRLTVNDNKCQKISTYISNYGQINYLPLRLFYRQYDVDETSTIPTQTEHDIYFSVSVFSLDLSLNDYQYVPNIKKMPNLKKLNISHNDLTIAKMFNNNELQSLKEIDFSYNKIKEIVINENFNVYTGLKKIWLSHNELLDISEAKFKNFLDLEFLDLSYNRISNIGLLTFESVTNIIFLKLSHNEIVDLNSSLFRFDKLKELYLNDNKIQSILLRDFDKLYSLEILDLSHNYIESLEKNVFDNLIQLKQLDLDGNLLSTIEANLFSLNINLESVYFSDNGITVLPIHLFQGKNVTFLSIKRNNLQGHLKRGMFEGLTLISNLDLSHQSIVAIEDYAFFGLDNIKELLLNNNRIRVLSNKSFKSLQKLMRLDLSCNQISQIDFDTEDLLSLQSLNFHGNHITQIKNDYLCNLHTLKFLDLSHNHLSRIETESFKTLSNVNSLVISNNPLEGNLETKTFDGLKSVPILDLSYTLINITNNASFDGMLQLLDLNISHSKIKELQYNTFSNTGSIKIMDLSYNEIEIFSINTTDLRNLEELLLNNNLLKLLYVDFLKELSLLTKLLLSNNFIKTIGNPTFKDQTSLRYIDLSNNANIKISFKVFKEVKNLQTLILSGVVTNITFKDIDIVPLTRIEVAHCNIKNLKSSNLYRLQKLQFLQISYNNIIQLDVGSFSNMTNLQEINLSYNQIKSIQPGVFKDNYNLNMLNLSHNSLVEVSYGALHGLINLNVLDVSYNSLGSLETQRFYTTPILKELIADHNRITDVSVENFSGIHLEKLSIGDNPLPCETVANFKKYFDSPFLITSLRHVQDNEENVYGITCNMNRYRYPSGSTSKDKSGTSNLNENILAEIRDLLIHFNVEKNRDKDNFKNENMSNVTQLLESSRLDYSNKLSQLNNITIELNEEQKNTNKLLERFIKLVTASNYFNRPLVPIKDNVTSDNFIKYINKIRQDLDNSMILDKEKIIAEIESKLLVINKRIESLAISTPLVPVMKNEKLSLTGESKSLLFLETCVAFILFIVVCLVLLKIYKSRLFIRRRRSLCTRQITDAMDTSNV